MGDINFSGANWETMTSSDPDEATTLDYFLERDFQQLLDSKLDIIMCDSVQGVTSCSEDLAIASMYASNGRPCSDHAAFTFTIARSPPTSAKVSSSPGNTFNKLAYGKADWEGIQQQLLSQPFSGAAFCYSNVNVLVDTWYKWLSRSISAFIPKITKHRKTLSPWVSPETSNLLKRKATMEKLQLRKFSTLREESLTALSNSIESMLLLEKEAYEERISGARRFSDIHRYLKSRRTEQVPGVVTWGDRTATNNVSKAELFNEYFYSVYSPGSPPLP